MCSNTPNGQVVVTLSGISWGAFDSLRAWDVSWRGPVKFDASSIATDEVAPTWLGDLAYVVSGQGGNSDRDTVPEQPELQCHTLNDIKNYYSKTDIQDKYKVIWRRYIK